MLFRFKDGKTVNLADQLTAATVEFKVSPNTINWRKMLLAMLAYQQAKFVGHEDLILNLEGMTPYQIDEKYEQINRTYGDIL